MKNKNANQQLPPYVPYRTWNTFLQRAKESEIPLPSRLDSSFWARLPFSGSNESALRRTLVFLDLVDAKACPKEDLEPLIISEGDERASILNRLVSHSYSDLLSQIDLRRGSMKQLQEYFKSVGADGKVGKMCISFFLGIAREANFELHRSLQGKAVSRKPKLPRCL